MGNLSVEDWNQRYMELSQKVSRRSPEVKPEPPKHNNHVWVFHTLIAVVALGCLVYWGNGNHVAVEVPVYDSKIIRDLQELNTALQHSVDAYKALAKNLEQQVKSRNAIVAQQEAQLKALSVSVPSQPVILQAIQKEAVTEKGLRQVVARNFGSEIAGRIEVRE